MSQFRPALESFVEGQTDLPALQGELRADLSREPSLAPVLGALIENTYRQGRINGPVYLDLMEVVRSTTPPAIPPAPVVKAPEDEETKYRPSAVSVGDDEATKYRPGERILADDQATALAPPEDRPRTGGNSTGPNWDSLQAASSQARPWRPGDTVKERFILEDIIGKGGMGVVFRVRDLRKEEAQDRNPYAALKVLGEDFKRHPESLKALQREARKAQTLAHPNIVTVYDFDRDGANVYIVMELLEGQPLDRYIKGLEGVGLTMVKALPIVRGLCGALGYAHEHQVVHSDFKPANAFITKHGTIKVFDFGIARAAKRPDANADDTSAMTLFDPGTLGALTPAYASCEMIEGLEPDPRDDIYALGCVVYELLTCTHPFERKTAVQARDAKMKPKPIRGLTSRQWRALRRSLAFDRDARTPSIARFLEEISPEKRSPALWGGIAAGVLVLGAVAALLVPDYLQRRRAEALASLIRTGTEESIQQALPGIEALPADARVTLLLDENLRSALIGHFSSKIDSATDASSQRYDYPQAEAQLVELRRLFPDSQAVSQIGEALTTRKNDEIKRQSDRLDDYLSKGWLVDTQNADSVAGVLRIVAQIDPKHPLLIDPRLPSAYAEQAQIALRKENVALAQSLTQAGLIVAPSDRTLKDLNDTVARELDAQRQATRMADLRRKLAGELSAATSLSAFDPVHEDLLVLQSAAANDSALTSARRRVEELLGNEIQTLTSRQSYDDAQALLAKYADIVQPQFVDARRSAIDAARGQPSSNGGADINRALDALLQASAADDTWDIKVHSQLAKLSAYLPAQDSAIVSARQRAAEVHVTAATTLRSQGRLSEAERTLQQARAFAPGLSVIAQEQQLLAQMRAEQDAKDREQKRLAELAALRQKLSDQATANDVAGATATLRDLRAGLPANDPFLTSAPKAIAGAYVRLAATAARNGRFDTAMSQIDRALEFDRTNPQIVAARAEYSQQLAAASKQTPPAQTPPAAATPSSAAPAPAKTDSSSQTAAQPAAQAPIQTAAVTPTTACTPALAGYGTRSRGVCFDSLPTGGRGPELVVVPAGAGAAKPFAISRFEVSAGEFAAFCKASGKCSNSAAQADLPITSIAASDAQNYVDWLSTTTGATYRLPTDEEWSYAASAPGGSTERDFNCVVEINGQKIRGFGLGSVRAGRPNSWGLYNLAGNAQEWARNGDGWNARGGAFSDPISQCSPALARSVGGTADAATGFRVVRDLK